MTRWEYINFAAGMHMSPAVRANELARLGQDGWELVSVIEDQFQTKFYFKRRLCQKN